MKILIIQQLLKRNNPTSFKKEQRIKFVRNKNDKNRILQHQVESMKTCNLNNKKLSLKQNFSSLKDNHYISIKKRLIKTNVRILKTKHLICQKQTFSNVNQTSRQFFPN